jgi:hypothetical protein
VLFPARFSFSPDYSLKVGLWESVRRCVHVECLQSARLGFAGWVWARLRRGFYFSKMAGGVMYGLKPVHFVRERKMRVLRLVRVRRDSTRTGTSALQPFRHPTDEDLSSPQRAKIARRGPRYPWGPRAGRPALRVLALLPPIAREIRKGWGTLERGRGRPRYSRSATPRTKTFPHPSEQRSLAGGPDIRGDPGPGGRRYKLLLGNGWGTGFVAS